MAKLTDVKGLNATWDLVDLWEAHEVMALKDQARKHAEKVAKLKGSNGGN